MTARIRTGFFVAVVAASFVATVSGDRWYCYKLADHNVDFYNGATGDYASAYDAVTLSGPYDWNSETVMSISGVGSYSTNDTINGSNANYGATGWAGTATNYNACVHSYSDTTVNQYYMDVEPQNNKKYVACHEMGHSFGLEHNSDSYSCMNSYLYDQNVYFPALVDRSTLEEVYCVGCDRIGLQANHGEWMTAPGGTGLGGTVSATASAVGAAETFVVRYLGSGYVGLQARNGQFVRAEGGGGSSVKSDANSIGSHERFYMVELGGGYVALQADNGQYVSSTSGGTVTAGANSVGSLETFYRSWQ